MACNFNLEDADFHGYATKNNIKCSDGRTIRHDAFAGNDGCEVPLMWGHNHASIDNVLGHAYLENRDDGVYAYGKFNETPNGLAAKEAVKNGDIRAMSIFARGIKQVGMDVVHGDIVEVSLVTVGANPGAVIDTVLSHGSDLGEEGTIFFNEPIELGCIAHSDEKDGEKTVADVLNTLTDEQMEAVSILLASKIDESDDEDDDSPESDEVKHSYDYNEMEDFEMSTHNIFDQTPDTQDDVIAHADFGQIVGDAEGMYGSLKKSAIAHGITQVDYLFPDYKSLNTPPEFIKRDTGWVQRVMNGVHHTPFSRIKSMFANITGDEARARGYIKGKLKKEEVFTLLKRTTDPQTVYKKQSMDRDDVIDITSFDVIAWLKSEMRMMLDEELARAYLIGDGRLPDSDDKISSSHIRPIATDAELYTIQKVVSRTDTAKAFITTAIKARKDYKGSGEPTLFTTEDMLTDMLLIEDAIGRALYPDVAALARKIRVKDIVTVPVMEGAKGAEDRELLGIIVNLVDYNVGADKGGAINLFDDFDIDYNKQKYLIETRCSGALIKPYSAIALTLEKNPSGNDHTGDTQTGDT